MSYQRFRSWTFVLHNYSDDDEDRIQSLDCKYIVYGREICPTTKTPHLQGYISFKSPKSFSSLRKQMPDKVHLERAISTAINNYRYCTKDNDFYEDGVMPQQPGTRNDLTQITNDIKDGATLRSFIGTVNYQQLRYAEKTLTYFESHRDSEVPVKVYWYFGDSGTGKTRTVYEKLRGKDYYTCNETGQWFDGYDGQKYVIIDDFRADFMVFHNFLRLIDRYEYKVQVKGGYRQMLATTFYITSPYSPREVYKNCENKQQLYRRITKVLYYTHEYPPIVMRPEDW